MGWTTTYEDVGNDSKSIREFLRKEFTWEKCEVIDDAKVGNTVFQAIRERKTGEAFGMVILIGRDQGFLSYKDMSEDMGPYQYNCPLHILDKLSPTTDKWANEWRRGCRNYHAKHKSQKQIPSGSIVKFSHPIKFSTGEKLNTFVLIRYGRRVRFFKYNEQTNTQTGYSIYSISGYAKRSPVVIGHIN